MQNNNNRNNRRNNNRRTNEQKKQPRQPKVNANEFKAELYLSSELNESVTNEIIDVLNSTRFDKISIPLTTYRALIDTNVDPADTRVSTIGYIRSYNVDDKTFDVIIFSNFTETIKSYDKLVIDLQFTMRNDSLGSIIKFNIVPVSFDDKENE